MVGIGGRTAEREKWPAYRLSGSEFCGSAGSGVPAHKDDRRPGPSHRTPAIFSEGPEAVA